MQAKKATRKKVGGKKLARKKLAGKKGGTKKGVRRKKAAKKTASRGRPAFKATPEQKAAVAEMSSIGVPQRGIAMIIRTSYSTLKRHFKTELEGGGRGTSGLAINCIIETISKGGRDGLRAAMFWLRTRENELFSERRINENRDLQAADELGKLSDEEACRVAENVLIAAQQNKEAREEGISNPSIDDEPHGTA